MFIKKIQDFIKQFDIDPSLVEVPQDRSMWDFSVPCFSLAKKRKKSPNIIAEELTKKMEEQIDTDHFLQEAVVTWPYINFFLKTTYVATYILTNISEKGFSYWSWEKKNHTVLVEWRSPNTHKMLHIWHLRNALISETICTISEFAWYDVIRSAYGWDIWAHVAKRLRYFQKFTDQTYPSDPEEFGIRSGNLYRESTLKIDENKEQYKQEIHEVQRLLESGDTELVKLRHETRDLSIAWLQKAFEELWCSIERYYRESEVEQPGIDLVKKFHDDSSITQIKTSQWAIIADLEAFDLWVFLLLKSNGTSLYSTKDIALAHLKKKEYSFDSSLYVVATEQNHHFEQLFKTLELTWFDISKLHHVWYELVELPEGKMSSRKWTVIPYHKRRKDSYELAYSLIQEREIDNKEHVAEMVSLWALKFSMLLQDTYKKIRIDIKKSISFEWETWPYLQYTYTRCKSILDKATILPIIENLWLHTKDNEERLLLLHLDEFPAVIQQASSEHKPSLVARYVLELCKMFNTYYHAKKILTDDSITSAGRLALVSWVETVLKTWLRLLWIEAPEKM